MTLDLSTVRPKPKPVRVKKTKKKPNKEARRRALEKASDVMCKKIILLRDEFCVCPAPKNGHSNVMQSGHLITRSKESVKFDLRNVNIQCSSCNLMHEFKPERYTLWFVERFGEGEYKSLVDDSEIVTKLSVEELEELLRQLTDIFQAQQNDRSFKPRFTQKEILSGQWRLSLKASE